MKNKTISITDNLYEQLSKETNASGLIVALLEEHYGKEQKQKKEAQDIITEIAGEEERKAEKEKHDAWIAEQVKKRTAEMMAQKENGLNATGRLAD